MCDLMCDVRIIRGAVGDGGGSWGEKSQTTMRNREDSVKQVTLAGFQQVEMGGRVGRASRPPCFE